MRDRVILDLCAGTGAWSEPYKLAGYTVVTVDLPQDVRLMEYREGRVWGILAAPPCTVFANSGARWPRSDAQKIEALGIVDACLRAVVLYRPRWWALENPVGKLSRWLGPAPYYFQPCWFGDRHTKRTALWGQFVPPAKGPCVDGDATVIHHMGATRDRAAKRAMTPPGFARAFYEANP